MNTKGIALPGDGQGITENNNGNGNTVNNNSTTEQKKTTEDVMAENVIHSCSIQKTKLFSQKAQEREWLIRDIIPDGGVTLLAGLGGAGKSTLALQLVLNVLLDTEHMFGNAVNGENSKCLYVTAEDDSIEMHSRLQDIAGYYVESVGVAEAKILDIEESNRLMVLTDDNVPKGYENLLTAKNHKNIIETKVNFSILKKVVEITKPRLVVLDALTSLFSCDFSNMADAQHVMRLCKELTTYGSSVLILHHMTKTAYSPLNFDSLLSAVFGSVGTLNKLRHLLIFWKNNLFIAKSNLVERHGWKLRRNQRAYEYEYPILSDFTFDEIVKRGDDYYPGCANEDDENNSSNTFSNMPITTIRKRR
jgi:RecA-family ATPase